MLEIENRLGFRAIIGFSMGENYYKDSKLFPYENIMSKKVGADYIPIASEFAFIIAKFSSGYSNELACNLFWQKLIPRTEEYYKKEKERESESSYYLKIIEREEETFEKNKVSLLEKKEFSYFFTPPVNVSRRRRNYISRTIIPDCNEYIFDNIHKFNYAFIFDLRAMKLNIYFENFPIKEKIKEKFGKMDYVCGFNPNSLSFATGASGYFNILEYAKRNHEQEVILKNNPCKKETKKKTK